MMMSSSPSTQNSSPPPPNNTTTSPDMSTLEGEVDADLAPLPPTPLPARRALFPRPNCTHIVMDYQYTDSMPCDNCHRPPALGFLYVCRQDIHSEALARRQMDSMNEIHEQDQLPSTIDEYKACGVSQSVIDQIKRGNVYDTFHIEVLRNQKVNLLQVMDQQLSKEHEPWNMPITHYRHVTSTNQDGDNTIQRNVTMRTGARTARAATSKLIQKLGHYRKRSEVIPKCGFKCCFACRPYLKDRAYISLESALSGSLDLERFLPQERPIANVTHVENLGLRQARKPSFLTKQHSSDEASDSSCSTSSDEDENDYVENAPLSSSRQASFWTNSTNASRALRPPPGLPIPASYTGVLRERAVPPGFGKAIRSRSAERNLREVADHTPSRQHPSNGLLKRITRKLAPIPRSASNMTMEEMLALDPLRRVQAHNRLSIDGNDTQEDTEIAQSELQNAKWAALGARGNDSPIGREIQMLRLGTERDGQVSPVSRHSDTPTSTSADEIQVEGGVAVTEEAVETHTPDLITQC